MRLTVSIVVFKSDPLLFLEALQSLSASIEYAKSQIEELFCELQIIENDHVKQQNLRQAERLLQEKGHFAFDEIIIRSVWSNLGYGSGHNVALRDSSSDFHLVLNPDVSLDVESVYEGLRYLQQTPDAALVCPKVVDGNGEPLYLCKRFPHLFDLLLRGFAPNWVKSFFIDRLARYEMHELRGQDTPVSDIEIVSGCFMLMPIACFRSIGGFDENFFLYFEDFDLSLRIASKGKLVYLPSMKIVHFGGYAANKGLYHIMLFCQSALKFYQRHGWRII